MSTRAELSAAWVEGATERVDFNNDVTAECPFETPNEAEAWSDGAAENRDIFGDANLTNNPYKD